MVLPADIEARALYTWSAGRVSRSHERRVSAAAQRADGQNVGQGTGVACRRRLERG